MLGPERLLPADLTGAILRSADLSGADLRRAILVGADLTRANTARRPDAPCRFHRRGSRGRPRTSAGGRTGHDACKVRRLGQGDLDMFVAAHERFVTGKPGGRKLSLKFVDLTGLDLAGRHLDDADFSGSVLENCQHGRRPAGARHPVRLRPARRRPARACLSRADMRGACLQGADLSEADLTQADFREGVIAIPHATKGLASVTPRDPSGPGRRRALRRRDPGRLAVRRRQRLQGRFHRLLDARRAADRRQSEGRRPVRRHAGRRRRRRGQSGGGSPVRRRS